MKRNSIRVLALVAAMGLSGAGQAALHDRGGGLIYDDVLDITWLQDYIAAQQSFSETYQTFGVEGIDEQGGMNWFTAQNWIAAMNAQSYLGFNNWRLPDIKPVNGSSFNTDFSDNGSTDLGRGNTSPNSELAYMWNVNRANELNFNELFPSIPWSDQWSRTEYSENTDLVWSFDPWSGIQGVASKDQLGYAWAVRDGDVAAVPEPETYALMLVGLGLVGFAARRRRG